MKQIGYHPKVKGKPITGERVLIVPVRGIRGKITIEMKDEAGRKIVLAGDQKRGRFWQTEELPDGSGSDFTIGIGEGVATILTFHQATGCNEEKGHK